MRHRTAHSRSGPGTLLLGVASFTPYEEHAEVGSGDLGWEDAEGSPDPDFIPLPPVVEERCSGDVKVGEGKGKGDPGLQMDPTKLSRPQQVDIVTANAQQHARGCCVQRI